MEKFVPADKLSKKKRRALHARRRKTWGGLNPVTRKPADPKAYNRKKARKWSDDTSIDRVFLFAENYMLFPVISRAATTPSATPEKLSVRFRIMLPNAYR